MKLLQSRTRLLAGAALGLGASVIAPQQAMAACTVTANSVTCATTTTTDTTNAGGTPAVDRNYPVNTSTANFTGTVNAGATVDGFGLAFTNTVGGTSDMIIVNNGAVQLNAGNAATAGGNDALTVTAVGATDVNYSGTGSVTNLGNGGNALEFNMNGTGALNATVGGNLTAGPTSGGYGLLANMNGTAGDANVTTLAGTTVQASYLGVAIYVNNAASTGNATLVNNATVASPTGAPNTIDYGVSIIQDGLGTATITNNGTIGSATDRVQIQGIEAIIGNAASTSALTVNGSGAIFTVGQGIHADNNGTGATVINYTGAIDTTAGDGINAAGTTGALSVTSGAITALGGNGITTVTTTGNQTISVGGNVTSDLDGVNATSTSGTIAVATTDGADITATDDAISVASAGNRTVTIGAGSVVTGDEAISSSGAGTTTITNAGTLTGTTATIFAVSTADGAYTITNQTGGIINGAVSLTDNNDTITNAGTLNLTGAQEFYLGTDVLTNQAGGVINVAAASPFNGLETLNNAGTVNAASGLLFDAGATALNNTGTINLAGALDLGDGADTFANTGTGILNLTGNASLVGVETLTQSGRINLNTFTLTGTGTLTNAGTIDTSGSAGLAGFTAFNNTGTLDLAAGTFTVPAVAFANSGTILADEGAATITGQTSFANTGTIDLQDGAVGDVLTINSSFAGSGASNLMVDFNETTADRLVITGAASGTTAVHANHVGAGLIDLDGVLVVDTASSSANAFVLGNVTGNVSPLIDYSLVQSGSDYFLLSTPNASAFDPLSLPVLAGTLWYQSADEVIAQTRLPAETVGLSYWGQVYGGRDKYGDDNDDQVIDGTTFEVDNELKTNRLGIQAGVDYGFGGGRVGVTAGWARAKADGDGDLELKAKGWNIGLYGQFGGAIGFHGEVLAKYDRYDVDFDDGIFDGVSSDARSTGIDGAVGYRFPLGGDATLDANVGLSHVWTKIDDIDAFGFEYDIDNLKSTRGRAGVRATFAGSLAPYVDATVYHEFNGDGDVDLFDGATFRELDTNGKNTYVRFEGGIAGRPTGPLLSAWADLGDRKGFGLRAGFRFGGAVEAAPVLAPPPPPPAEVAPATQTCPDGSVILATSTCPPPPPPPPPPVERGERG